MRSQDRIAYLAALSLLMSAAELLVPRILPFFRLGLANIPLLLALGMAPGHFALLLLLKAIGNAYISGTLFSVFAIISIAQTFASGIMMYALSRLFGRRISIYSVSAMGALAVRGTRYARLPAADAHALAALLHTRGLPLDAP